VGNTHLRRFPLAAVFQGGEKKENILPTSSCSSARWQKKKREKAQQEQDKTGAAGPRELQ